MKQKIILAVALLLSAISVSAQRLTIGGYGEAMYTRNFYSDAWQRYITPEKYAKDKSHGRFDIPHFVINLGYDFGLRPSYFLFLVRELLKLPPT